MLRPKLRVIASSQSAWCVFRLGFQPVEPVCLIQVEPSPFDDRLILICSQSHEEHGHIDHGFGKTVFPIKAIPLFGDFLILVPLQS